MIDYKELLAMTCHADHGSRQAEHLPLYTTDGEESDHKGAGGHGNPALTQTQRTCIFSFGKIHHPLLMCVPAWEVQTLDLTIIKKR